jgi:hypothetical protein
MGKLFAATVAALPASQDAQSPIRKLEAATRAAKETANTSSNTRFAPITLPVTKALTA